MTIEDIEKAISKLSPRELDRFRAWFEEFQAARFDQKIERDAQSGKLDRLADAAVADFRRAVHSSVSCRRRAQGNFSATREHR